MWYGISGIPISRLIHGSGPAQPVQEPHGHGAGPQRRERSRSVARDGGAMTGDRFLAFVVDALLPALRKGDVVAMDGLSAHKTKAARVAFTAAGMRSALPAALLARVQSYRARPTRRGGVLGGRQGAAAWRRGSDTGPAAGRRRRRVGRGRDRVGGEMDPALWLPAQERVTLTLAARRGPLTPEALRLGGGTAAIGERLASDNLSSRAKRLASARCLGVRGGERGE